MESKKERIAALERLIQGYQASYYNGEAEISDSEFDLLWDELKSLAPDSEVLKKVGSGPDVDGFPKAKHLIPMGSQDKASNPKEFLDWAKKTAMKAQNSPNDRQKKTEKTKEQKTLTIINNELTRIFIVQYKLDGASLELQYEKGKLQRAVTRGDGVTGDDITANARRMAGAVQKLDIPFTGGVRGEVVMTHDVWKGKYSTKANCRNAANGLMRRKDGQGCEDLRVIVYDAAASGDDHFFQDEKQKLEWLTKRGFETTVTKVFSTAQEVIAYRDEVAAKRDKLPFDIDGLVVKDIETDMADLRRARPEKQIAFKFELETAFSVLREIQWSESGATYTPIGIIDPVRLAGTTVKRANLNNPDMIRAMGLKIGSTVSVVKRGEIIPKIEGLAPLGAMPVQPSTETEEIVFPKTCLSCGSKLVDGGTRLYCPNPGCPKRLLHRLEKWVSVLDIRELGVKLIDQLFEKERVRNIHELYTLMTDELAEYDRMGGLSAAKVIRHIQTKRSLSLAVFVAGFDLEGIAETTMEKIASAGFDTLEKLRAATVDDFAAVYGLGEITASVIVEGLKECVSEMDAVLKTGVITIAPPPSEEMQPMRGLSFCFTGELKSMKRGEAEEKIKALGAQAKSSVVKGLSYLVTNDPASSSSKNKKASELGIEIIDEEQFLALLSKAEKPASVQGDLFA
ncbi:MAG: NAD-dependent DNA ligase LigA [Treponema sp.]|jgi:DNA ligase (NAD+)|nr:NAD-dependent DNA ligase LigA [Treponema sp.]